MAGGQCELGEHSPSKEKGSGPGVFCGGHMERMSQRAPAARSAARRKEARIREARGCGRGARGPGAPGRANGLTTKERENGGSGAGGGRDDGLPVTAEN